MGWLAGCHFFFSLGIFSEAAEWRPLLVIVNGSTLDPLCPKSMCPPTFLVDTIVSGYLKVGITVPVGRLRCSRRETDVAADGGRMGHYSASRSASQVTRKPGQPSTVCEPGIFDRA
jgi:hypothetical protein